MRWNCPLKQQSTALEQFTKAELKVTREELKALELSTRRDLQQMELRLTHNLTLRLGSMMVISIGAAASLATLI